MAWFERLVTNGTSFPVFLESRSFSIHQYRFHLFYKFLFFAMIIRFYTFFYFISIRHNTEVLRVVMKQLRQCIIVVRSPKEVSIKSHKSLEGAYHKLIFFFKKKTFCSILKILYFASLKSQYNKPTKAV